MGPSQSKQPNKKENQLNKKKGITRKDQNSEQSTPRKKAKSNPQIPTAGLTESQFMKGKGTYKQVDNKQPDQGQSNRQKFDINSQCQQQGVLTKLKPNQGQKPKPNQGQKRVKSNTQEIKHKKPKKPNENRKRGRIVQQGGGSSMCVIF